MEVSLQREHKLVDIKINLLLPFMEATMISSFLFSEIKYLVAETANLVSMVNIETKLGLNLRLPS